MSPRPKRLCDKSLAWCKLSVAVSLQAKIHIPYHRFARVFLAAICISLRSKISSKEGKAPVVQFAVSNPVSGRPS